MKKQTRKRTTKTMVLSLLISASHLATSANLPPRNPYLADSHCSMGHCDSAQQNSIGLAGPAGPSKTLSNQEIDYAPVGPIHYSSNISSVCPDGGRVMWGHGIDRIVKLDHDSFALVAEYYFPGVEAYSEEDAEVSINRLNNNNSGLPGVINAFRDAMKLPKLPGVYTLLDKDNRYYIGKMDGSIAAYTDEQPGQCRSGIKPYKTFTLPEEVSGNLIGMNMTFDGWLVLATEFGYVIAVNRELDDYRIVKLPHSDVAEEQSFGPGKGWIRNGFSVDDTGGIYLVSQDYLHKVVWTGKNLSIATEDGAWSEPYINEDMIGSGSTPSMMGFGDEDELVIITDGQRQMHLTAFWRNEIPADWEGIAGAPSRRIAGLAPVTMGDPTLSDIQSEQTVAVAGYGAFVVNNTPRNFPWYLPEYPGYLLVSGFLGSNPHYQPYGVEKLRWDSQSRKLISAWGRQDISSPNSVPLISLPSGLVYILSARNNQWLLLGLDWNTGDEQFSYVIGDQRYNGMGSGIQLDEAGRINYSGQWGRIRLRPGA